MRIGIDARSVYSGHGGIGTYVRELVRALARRDQKNQYFVLCTDRKGPEPIASAPNVTEISCPAAMLDWRWEQLQLPTLAEELGLDLVHMTCFGALIAKPCPVVSTIYDVVFRERPELVEPRLAASLDRAASQAAREADHVITLSNHAREAIGRAYGTALDRIMVVYAAPAADFHPRDRSQAEQRMRARFGLAAGYLLYVGALEPKKNIDGLLDAFSHLLQHGFPDQVLVLAGGEGGMPYDVGRAVRLRRLERSVRVLGYLPDEDLPALYAAAGVFVYASLYEGFGLPPLEAMACGTPTVVSNSTSLPEVVGNAALLVDPEDPAAIADATMAVLSDPVLAGDLSRRGRERAKQFTWGNAAVETLQVYRNVVGQGSVI
jgi:glycosyltransferase involved in cell wall biosynthesis